MPACTPPGNGVRTTRTRPLPTFDCAHNASRLLSGRDAQWYMPPFSTISSHVPFRLDRSIRRLHAHRRKSQVRRNLVNQRKERIVRFASLSSPLPFHICSSAKDGQNAKINVLILTHLHVSLVPFFRNFRPRFFFFTRVRPNGPREGWKTERRGAFANTRAHRKAKRANFNLDLWRRGEGGEVHGEYHNARSTLRK